MVSLQDSLAVTLTFALLSSRIYVHGSTENCPTNAVLDLSENLETAIIPPEATWFKGGKKLGCSCDFKTCVSLCCPVEMGRTEGNCIKDNVTLDILSLFQKFNEKQEENVVIKNVNLFANDPCLVGWMTPWLLEDFQVYKNGSIYTPDFRGGSLSDFEHYCLFRKPGSSVYWAKICRPLPREAWDIFCLTVAILFMVAVFIGYTIVPELRNFHGLIFRCYVATYIVAYAWTLLAQFTTLSRTYARVFSISVFFGHYCACSCSLWLNVMSFNIWRTFRSLRPSSCNSKSNERKKFICYAIYSWGTSALMVTSCVAAMWYVPYFRNDTIGEALKQWGSVGIIFVVFGCNTFMYISTAIKIRQYKKDIANLANGVNKHYEVDKKWFNLHVKLFLIMGGHMMMWALWVIWSIPFMTALLVAVEVLQSFLISVVFLWKDNIKRSLYEQFCLKKNSPNPSQNSSELLVRVNES